MQNNISSFSGSFRTISLVESRPHRRLKFFDVAPASTAEKEIKPRSASYRLPLRGHNPPLCVVVLSAATSDLKRLG